MFLYDSAKFWYEPFPVGLISPLVDDVCYKSMVESFPPLERFVWRPDYGGKYSLSELNEPRRYRETVRSCPLWRELHRWVKSDEFLYATLDLLARHRIDLGLRRKKQTRRARLFGLARTALRGQIPSSLPPVAARFEFSALPAQGGCVLPHTDSPTKLVSLVIPIVAAGEWRDEYGGGFEVSRPRDVSHNYNLRNTYLSFDEVEPVRTIEHRPNRGVIFVKTFNSLHCVRPMKGRDDPRRTLTIAIEHP